MMVASGLGMPYVAVRGSYHPRSSNPRRHARGRRDPACLRRPASRLNCRGCPEVDPLPPTAPLDILETKAQRILFACLSRVTPHAAISLLPLNCKEASALRASDINAHLERGGPGRKGRLVTISLRYKCAEEETPNMYTSLKANVLGLHLK